MVIINRKKELDILKRLGDWVYICGRRKTGKTFFVKNFVNYDEYFFVGRDRTIFHNEIKLSYEAFFELFKEIIKNKKIVIDEFHRLPRDFFDYLHATKKGKLIAISSTLWLSRKLLGRGEPLLNLFSLVIFGLADEKDVINSLKLKNIKEVIEASVYLREPMLAFNYKPPIRQYITTFLYANKLTIKEIIGEVFSEEERHISLVYEGILRAVASGKITTTEISGYLFSRKLIKKDNPGLIQRYLDVLVKIGLLKKIQVWQKKKFVYKHVSPLFDLHFYLDEKYNYVENDIPEKFIQKVVNEKLPMHVEDFFSNLFSKLYGLKQVKVENPEIDISLVKFKKLSLVAEVKWKNNISEKELKIIGDKLNKFACRKILVVPNKKIFKRKVKNIEVLDVKRVLNLLGL